jgi:IMP dehydrogenase
MHRILPHTALTFNDVHLVPQLSSIESRRTGVDISVRLRRTNIKLPTPFIASPMDKVSGLELCTAMHTLNGGMGILHRFNTIEDQVAILKSALISAPEAIIGAAVGVNGDYVERAQAVLEAGASLICIDVAHGHHTLMRRALLHLRERHPDTHIMAGNVATLAGFNDLSDWGADSVRVGIGSGSICSTRMNTGYGYPMLQSILDISATTRPAQIISDGGIREYGDIVKAIAAGADFVMMGSMFAGTKEAPGDLIETDRGPMKLYRGQASKEAQIDWRGFYSSNEGISTMVPYKGDLENVLADMKNGLTTGCSYNGAANLAELREKAVFVKVSNSSAVEAGTHILQRN